MFLGSELLHRLLYSLLASYNDEQLKFGTLQDITQ